MGEMDRVRAKYEQLRWVMDERVTRLWAAAEPESLERGGIAAVVEATGISKSRIRAGVRDLVELALHPPVEAARDQRIRPPGGGRPELIESDRTLVSDLESLVDPVTCGDRESALRWTTKSKAKLSRNWGPALGDTAGLAPRHVARHAMPHGTNRLHRENPGRAHPCAARGTANLPPPQRAHASRAPRSRGPSPSCRCHRHARRKPRHPAGGHPADHRGLAAHAGPSPERGSPLRRGVRPRRANRPNCGIGRGRPRWAPRGRRMAAAAQPIARRLRSARAGSNRHRSGDGCRRPWPARVWRIRIVSLVYRLVRKKYTKRADLLAGEGAALVGGRWNEKGTRLVYASSHVSLVTLEALVHASTLPKDVVLVS